MPASTSRTYDEMSVRTVVRIQEDQKGNTVFSLESPKGFQDAGLLWPLQSRPEDSPFSDLRTGDGTPNLVLQSGQKLFDDLSSHPAVDSAITQALTEAEGGCSPLFLRLDDVTKAEDLPWESFYKQGKEFLALDNRWPVVRVRDTSEADPRLVYDFEPPLRIVAVLSAAGKDEATRVPASPQWDSLLRAITGAQSRPNFVPVELTVFVGEEGLLNKINTLQRSWIRCSLITDREGLLQAIRDSSPHLLHFFCHGTSEEIPHLTIGSFTDWEAERDGTIAVTAGELRQSADPNKEIWLVTLNCCESAMRARDAKGIASSLVLAGFPAALGMREMIDVKLAHALCESFYPAVLDLIAEAKVDGPVRSIEWAQALSIVRGRLAITGQAGSPAQQAARNCKDWTIPVLYTRREGFQLKRIAARANPLLGLSPGKRHLIDYLQELQRQRTKAAEDYKDLPPDALKAILDDFDSQLAKATKQLKES
jgi:hypothetical protein